jgi:hypothetical protein
MSGDRDTHYSSTCVKDGEARAEKEGKRLFFIGVGIIAVGCFFGPSYPLVAGIGLVAGALVARRGIAIIQRTSGN